MKVLVATISLSLALPGLPLSTSYAQAAAGGGAAGSGGGVRGAATASGATAAPTGRIAPTGVLAGQAATPGTGVSSPASGQLVTGGQTIAPGAPLGTLNPGQISATPPNVVGRTFDRTPIAGPPADSIIDPSRPQPTFRFPPPSTLPQAVVTNTGVGGQFDSGLPEAAVFPPGNPVGVGNTVGTNFGRVIGVAPEPVIVNLPPGARVVTNAFGVPEVGVPPPAIVPADTGRGPTFESSAARSSATTRPREVPQRSAPPRNAPITPR